MPCVGRTSFGSTWYFMPYADVCRYEEKGAALMTSEGAEAHLAKSNFAESLSPVLVSNSEI